MATRAEAGVVYGAGLVRNALLGLGTALAPALVVVFVGIGLWWGLPLLTAILIAAAVVAVAMGALSFIIVRELRPATARTAIAPETTEEDRMSLDNKVAIVTGSSSGIGRAIALELARQGAAVTINYHKGEDEAHAVKGECEAAGGRAHVIGADVGTVAEIQRLVDETVATFGRLDIMVNNAGMETRTSTLDTTERQFDMVIAVDLKSAFFGVQMAAKQMIAQGGGGRIINISSIHEDWPMPGNAPYCLAKGGVRMLTRTAGVELAPHGITVVGVAPGAVHTPIDEVTLADPVQKAKLESAIPLGRVAEPEEIARLVAFLASDGASYGTATTYVADGGMMQASVGL